MISKRNGLYTAECVSIGHPDKLCDLIADKILDVYAFNDTPRVGIEVAIKNDKVFVFGEVTSKTNVDIKKCVRDVYNYVGYDASNLEITTEISKQSPDIAKGVDIGGAGDQGIMFGYACRDTIEKMPLPCMIAKEICNNITNLTKEFGYRYLRPDGKSQVTAEYINGRCAGIKTIVVSWSHDAGFYNDVVREINCEIELALEKYGIYNTDGIDIIINPAGDFTICGAYADSGLTGRKIAVDNYGSFCPVGGGSFSGKDPTKVDRSGAYMARAIAVGILNQFHEVDECKVQLAYAIGKEDPVAIQVDVDTDNDEIKEKIDTIINNLNDWGCFTPDGIITMLGLDYMLTSCYFDIAVNGHFTNPQYIWNHFAFNKKAMEKC